MPIQGKLTLKQRKFIKAYLITGNATEAAKQAGYQGNSDDTFAKIGSRLVRNVEGSIEQIMTEMGLDDVSLARYIYDGLNANNPKGFPDWFARAKFTEIAARVKGLFKDRVDHVGSGTITIRIKGRPERIENKQPVIEIGDQMLEIPEKVER